jgi:ferrochelatase
MSTRAEPPFQHGVPTRGASYPRVGVLLCNLGTPQAPTGPALRRYLAQFLSDPRVIEIPKALWLLILHGIILRVRPAKSALKYASIWTPKGSPLAVWSQAQAEGLQAALCSAGHPVAVRLAMRYGHPAMAEQLDAFKADGIEHVLVLPLYPQYSATTTASVFDAVASWGQTVRRLPEFRFVNHYHDHPAYIRALAEQIRAHWAVHGRGEKLVLSFHGVPERTLHLGDPYHCECLKTARLVRESLGLGTDEVVVTFQSRFGRAIWLQPYTEPTVVALAQQGLRKIDLACPGFPADCLETLEEINQEVRHAFMAAGGTRFQYIPCLNDSPLWLEGLAQIAQQHLQGWPTQAGDAAEEWAQRQVRALAAGAPS